MCVCVYGRTLPVRHHQLGHLSEEQDAVDAGGLTPGSFPPITFRSFAQSSVQSYSFKRRSTEVSRTYTWLDTVRHLRRERVARTVSSRVKAAAAAGLKTVRVESGRPVPPPASNVSRCVLFSTNYTRGSHLSHTIRTPFARRGFSSFLQAFDAIDTIGCFHRSLPMITSAVKKTRKHVHLIELL